MPPPSLGKIGLSGERHGPVAPGNATVREANLKIGGGANFRLGEPSTEFREDPRAVADPENSGCGG